MDYLTCLVISYITYKIRICFQLIIYYQDFEVPLSTSKQIIINKHLINFLEAYRPLLTLQIYHLLA